MNRFFLIAIALSCSSLALGFSSFKATLSGGHYRDIEKNTHSTIFFNWNYSYLSKAGYNGYLEFGINNNLVRDKWGAYPYQVFVTKKYKSGDVTIGRQFFSELFEVGLFDGVNANYSITKNIGVKAFAGLLGDMEETDYDFHNQLYGTLFQYKNKNLVVNLGPTLSVREGSTRSLLHGTIYYAVEQIPLKPTFLIKEQWDVPGVKNDQRLYDLQLSAGPVFVNFSYASRKPDPLLIPGRSYIYKLFSTSHQETKSVSLFVDLGQGVSVSVKAEEIDYNYLAREEEGDLQELSLMLGDKKVSVSTSLTRLNSYGGNYWNYGLKCKYNLSDTIGLIASGDLTKVKKINGINGYAYHGRGGFDFQFQSRWRAMINAEVERNHLFDFDVRAVTYLTYYYF